MIKKIYGDKKNIILFIILLTGSILYLSLIFNNNLWVDEAFTATLIRGSLSRVWSETAADTLPPFYNFFTKFITMLLGYNAPAMKFSSVLAMIATLFYGSFRIKNLFSFKEAILFSIFFLTMPYLYYYGVEIRPYSWGLFFAFGVALAFKETVSSESYRAYIKFAVFSALSGYAHHFALVASAFFWFFLFIYLLFSKSKKIRRFFIALLIFTVMYLPCFLLAIYQIRNASSYFSMSPLSLSSFLSDLRFPFVTHYTPLSMLLMIIFLFAFLVGLIYFIKGDYNLYSPLIYAALPVFVTVFGYAVSFSAGTSYFTSRYLIPSIGILWLGVAILLVRVLTSMPLIPMQILSVIFSIIILFSGFINYRSQFLSEYDNSVNEMTYWFDENLSADDGYIIYESAYQIEICMRYYYPNLKKYDYSNINEIKGNIWYFEVDGYENELEKASSLGYNIVYIKDMAFDRYNFKLYQLVKK